MRHKTINMATKTIQKSIDWQDGKFQPAGIRRRLWYLAVSAIAANYTFDLDATTGMPTSAVVKTGPTLKADEKWRYIDFIPEKSSATSEPQGEYPSQTQLDKLKVVLPGTDPATTAAVSYINNHRCLFVYEDNSNNKRIVGNPDFPIKQTISQDLGEGPAGTANTTLNVEATNIIAMPFLTGELVTETTPTT